MNISSDAAATPYAGWGAYGASKAALQHLTAIWAAEAEALGIRFLSVDPGDMDTPLHALAVPDADPATLKRPETAAAEIVAAIGRALAQLGFAEVGEVRQGKLIELDLAETDRARAAQRLQAMCEQLLANPVIETYAVSIDD